MPIFQYRGYRGDGSEVAGTVEAASHRDAVLRLRDSGLHPKKVSEAAPGSRFSFSRGSDLSLLPSITRQLSTLISSGVPLMEALRSLADEQKGTWHRMLVDVKEKVEGGTSFSKALEGYRRIFPEFYTNMVAAGETSGNLDTVLARLADFLEEQETLKSRVRTSLVYPVFMICVGFVVLSFLFTFVIPKITKIFSDTGGALPFITVVLITVSRIFQDYWWVLLGALAAVLFAFRRLRERHRLLIDRVLMRMPGNVLQSLYYGRFARTLGFLLEGGLPVLRALEFAAKAIGNRVLEQRVSEAGRKVAEGARLSPSLEAFPPVFLQLISTGERSGRLSEVLGRAADAYEEEFSRKVQKTLSLLEPVMILVMGLIVGFIVLAVLLPIFQLNQLIK
jgi:general secretion pathway protein F